MRGQTALALSGLMEEVVMEISEELTKFSCRKASQPLEVCHGRGHIIFKRTLAVVTFDPSSFFSDP